MPINDKKQQCKYTFKQFSTRMVNKFHDGVIKWKHFPHHWLFVRGIHQSPVNSPHKGQWRGTLMFSLISVWTIGWVNNRDAGDLRRHPAHYDVTVMFMSRYCHQSTSPVHLWMSVVLIRLGYEAHCSSKRLLSMQPLRPKRSLCPPLMTRQWRHFGVNDFVIIYMLKVGD